MSLSSSASIDPTALAAALREALPADQRHLAAELAAAVVAHVGGTGRNGLDAQLRPALAALAGKAIPLFDLAGAQLGDFRIEGDVAGGNISKPTFNITIYAVSPSAAPMPVDAARQDLIAAVRLIWIKGLLEKSLYRQVQIDLGLASDPQRVELPFRAQVREMGGPARDLPSETRLRNLYTTYRGALLILGAPGGGKTTLLLELARDLLDDAERDPIAPIPVVFNLASWAEQREPLERWIVGELRQRQRYSIDQADAERWLAAGLLRPFLDGLDEVAEEHQGECVAAINAFREQYGRMPPVVAMRDEDYARLEASGHKLALQAAIVVQRLSDAQVRRFFAEAGTSLAGLREAWEGDAVLRELADTPLMLSVLATVYQGKGADAVPQVGDVEQRRAVVFDAYIDEVFARRGAPRYSKAATVRYLGWLADKLQRDDRSVFYIEELQPEWMREMELKRSYLKIVWSFILALLVLALLIVSVTSNLAYGQETPLYTVVLLAIVIGAIAGIFLPLYKKDPLFYTRAAIPVTIIDRLSWSWKDAGCGFLFGLQSVPRSMWSQRGGVVVIAIMIFTLAIAPGGLRAAFGLLWFALLVYGATACVFASFSTFLEGVQPIEDPTFRMQPNQGVRNSLRSLLYASLIVSVGAGLLLSVFFAAGSMLISWLLGVISPAVSPEMMNYPLIAGIAALVGLGIGFVGGLTRAPIRFGAYPLIGHFLLRITIIQGKVGPWNYERFLNHCSERILMRRVGGGYIFLHRTLLDHFADRHVATMPRTRPQLEQ